MFDPLTFVIMKSQKKMTESLQGIASEKQHGNLRGKRSFNHHFKLITGQLARIVLNESKFERFKDTSHNLHFEITRMRSEDEKGLTHCLTVYETQKRPQPDVDAEINGDTIVSQLAVLPATLDNFNFTLSKEQVRLCSKNHIRKRRMIFYAMQVDQSIVIYRKVIAFVRPEEDFPGPPR